MKYDRLGVILINAVKEQQQQIDAQAKLLAEQKELNKRLQEQVNRLLSQMCKADSTTEICERKD